MAKAAYILSGRFGLGITWHQHIPAIHGERIPNDDWLDRKQAAAYLTSIGYSISPQTLAHMAANNNARKGPAFTKFGWTRTRYRRAELDAWVRAQMRSIR